MAFSDVIKPHHYRIDTFDWGSQKEEHINYCNNQTPKLYNQTFCSQVKIYCLLLTRNKVEVTNDC